MFSFSHFQNELLLHFSRLLSRLNSFHSIQPSLTQRQRLSGSHFESLMVFIILKKDAKDWTKSENPTEKQFDKNELIQWKWKWKFRPLILFSLNFKCENFSNTFIFTLRTCQKFSFRLMNRIFLFIVFFSFANAAVPFFSLWFLFLFVYCFTFWHCDSLTAKKVQQTEWMNLSRRRFLRNIANMNENMKYENFKFISSFHWLKEFRINLINHSFNIWNVNWFAHLDEFLLWMRCKLSIFITFWWLIGMRFRYLDPDSSFFWIWEISKRMADADETKSM